MAEAGHMFTARNMKAMTSSYRLHGAGAEARGRFNPLNPITTQRLKITASKKNDFSLLTNRSSSNKKGRGLIKISTSGSKWEGKWSSDYLLTLRDLQLEDLVEDQDQKQNAHVFINLCVHKHASFGLTVDGKIATSFTRKCCTCSLPYCREINTNFNVWILPSSRANRRNETQLPEIGGDDPSVIYVKPGLEADLDSLVRDTIRLTTSAKDTCSEQCEKSQPVVQFIGAQNAASTDQMWSKLLELRKSII